MCIYLIFQSKYLGMNRLLPNYGHDCAMFGAAANRENYYRTMVARW